MPILRSTTGTTGDSASCSATGSRARARKPRLLSSYAELLRTPGAARFVVPALAGRLPYAMLGLGIVLLVRHTTGSYGTAGAVAATAAVALAMVGPQTGRLADRYGQAAVLVPGAALHAAAVTTLTAVALSGAPAWALYAAAAAAGASVPQIGPMVRARWAARLDGRPLLGTAFAFESVTDEFTFVVGPVAATVLATSVHPAAALLTAAGLTVAGSLGLAAHRSSTPPPRAPGAGRRGSSAMRVAGARVLVAAFVCVGAVFGTSQVSVTAFAEEQGHPGMAGPLYALFACGSLVAGVLHGVIAWRRAARTRLVVTFVMLTAGTLPLWAVPTVGAMLPVLLLCGLAVAPALITGYTLADTLVPADARTEAFTWLTGAIGLGLAAGSALAGLTADARGASAGLALTFGAAATGLVVVAAGHRALRPRPDRVVDVPAGNAAPLALGR